MHLRMSTSYTDDVIAVQYISGSRKVGCHFQSSVHPNQTILSPSKSEPSTCIQWSMYWILTTNIILMSCQRCWRLVSRRQCIKYLYEWCVFPNDANCEWSSIESRDHFSCVTFADYIHPFYSFKGSFVPALPSVNQNNGSMYRKRGRGSCLTDNNHVGIGMKFSGRGLRRSWVTLMQPQSTISSRVHWST